MPPPSARSSAAQTPNGYTLEWAEHEFEPSDGLVQNPTWQDVEAIIGNDLAAERAALGARGRIVVRASGTEPVVRVMVEAPDDATANACAARIVALVERTFSVV